MLFYVIANTFSKTDMFKDETYWGDIGESQFSVQEHEDGDLGRNSLLKLKEDFKNHM